MDDWHIVSVSCGDSYFNRTIHLELFLFSFLMHVWEYQYQKYGVSLDLISYLLSSLGTLLSNLTVGYNAAGKDFHHC